MVVLRGVGGLITPLLPAPVCADAAMVRVPVSSECGTRETVAARFWPWLEPCFLMAGAEIERQRDRESA